MSRPISSLNSGLRRVRAVLCDLDDTLFDHAGATRDALAGLRRSEPAFAAWTLEEFDERHREILDELHGDVLAGRRSVVEARAVRFGRLLTAVGADARAASVDAVANVYRAAYESAWRPVPGASAFVSALTRSGAAVAIVTNNLREEQVRKIARCGFDRAIDALVTSEEVGLAKPAPEMFTEALRRVGAHAKDAVMLGDAWATDIVGAQAAGVRAVWFNRGRHATRDPTVAEIPSLTPLDRLLRVLGVSAGR